MEGKMIHVAICNTIDMKIILGGLDIMMIVLSVVQLCVTITFCVLTGKALCKKDEDEKLDPELYQPLLEDDTAGAA
ncbi:transmembrane protein 176A-like [Labeo rohita]|uniref:Transmembrane protein 176A-like n=1 Tax=Labeo rohita TaxID=84645 RepID=A0A498P1E5_LABRO|nr:transmembrane protein 176A-like [Labeo rohita]